MTNTKPTDKYWWKPKTNQWGQRWKKENKNGSAHTFGARMTSYHMLHHHNTLQYRWKLSAPHSPPSSHLYPYFILYDRSRKQEWKVLYFVLLFTLISWTISNTFHFLCLQCCLLFLFWLSSSSLSLSLSLSSSLFHEIFIIISCTRH